MPGKSFDYSASLNDNVSPGFAKMSEAANLAKTALGNIAPTASSMAAALAEITKSLDPTIPLVDQLATNLQKLQTAGGIPPEFAAAIQNLQKQGIDASTGVTALSEALQRVTPDAVAGAASMEKLAAGESQVAAGARTEAEALNQAHASQGQAAGSGGGLSSILQQMGVGFIYTHANLGPFTIGLGGLVQQLADVNPLLAGAVIGLTAVGAALATSAKEAIAWQAELNQIQANTGATNTALAQMGQAVMTAFTAGTSSLQDLGAAEQHITNMSFDAADSIKILSVANEAAANTGADVNDVANLTAMTLYHYGEGADQASTALNILTEAAQLGNTTFKDFSENSQKATSIAGSLGVPLTDTAAALSVLTKAYGSSAVAQTQFVNILTHIVNPAKAARTEIESLSQKTGVNLTADFSAAGLQAKGLSGILDDLHTVFNQLGLSQANATQEAMKLINAQRGGLGISFLLTSGQQSYNAALQEFAGVTSGQANPVADQFAKTQQTVQFQMQNLGNVIQTYAIQLGSQLLPTITAAIDAFGKFLGIVVQVGQALGTVLGPVLSLIGTALNAIGTFLSDVGAKFDDHSKKVADAAAAYDQYGQSVNDGMQKGTQAVQTNLDAQQALLDSAAQDAGNTGTDTGSTYSTNVGGGISDGTSSSVQPAVDTVKTTMDVTLASGQRGYIVGQSYSIGGGDGSTTGVAPGITSGKDAVSTAADNLVKTTDKTPQMGAVGGSMGLEYVRTLNSTIDSGMTAANKKLNAYLAQVAKVTGQAPTSLPNWTNLTNGPYPSAPNLSGGGTVGDPGYAGSRDSRPYVPEPLGPQTPGYQGPEDSRQGAGTFKSLADLEAYVKKNAAFAEQNKPWVGWDEKGNPVSDTSKAWTLLDGVTPGPLQIKADKPGRKGPKGPSAASLANKAYNAEQGQTASSKGLQDIADKEHQATADNAVKVDEGHAAQDVAVVKAAIDNLNQSMKASKAEEQGLLDPLQDQLKKAQATLKDMQSEHKIVTDSMKEQIYQYEQTLTKMKDQLAVTLKPLQEASYAAAQAIHKLQEETAAADHAFQQLEQPLQDFIYNLEQAQQAATGALSPLQQQLTALQDQMYALQQASKAALQPLDDALYGQNLKLAGMKEHVQDLSALYDSRLIPLQKQLADIQWTQTQNTQQADLANLSTTVSNISENLQNAKKGTAEYNALLQQQGQATQELNSKRKEYTIGDEIHAIQDAKTAAVDAANAQVTAQEKIVAALQKQRDAVARTYELQMRAVQAQIDATQRQMDLTNRQFEQQKAIAQQQLDAVTRAQQLYDRQQADKLYAKQLDKQNADDAIEAAQHEYDVKSALITDEENKVNERLTVYQHDASLQEAAVQGTIDDLNNNIGSIQDKYAAIQKGIQTQLDAVTGYGQDLAAADTAVTTSAKNYAQSLKDTKTAQDDYYSTQAAIAKYAHDFGVSIDTANKVFLSMGGTDGTLPKATTAMNALGGSSTAAIPTTKTAVDNLTTSLGTGGLSGAVTTLGTSTTAGLQTVANGFLKFFGGPSDPNFDPSVSIEWMLDTHNTTGFWGRIFYQWGAAFGETGLQKILHDSLVTLGTNVKPYLDTFAAVFTDGGTLAATNFATAFVAGLNSKMANITLHVTADGGSGNPAGTAPAGTTPPPAVSGNSQWYTPQAQVGAFTGGSSYLPSYVSSLAGTGVPVIYNDHSTYQIAITVPSGEGMPAPGDWQSWRKHARDISYATRVVVGRGA